MTIIKGNFLGGGGEAVSISEDGGGGSSAAGGVADTDKGLEDAATAEGAGIPGKGFCGRSIEGSSFG